MIGGWFQPLVITGSLALLCACPNGSSTKKNGGIQRAKVRSYTESAPVRAVVATAQYAFSTAERGLRRWDLKSASAITLSAQHGLPGDRVSAMVSDHERGWVWIATDGGVTRYDVKSETFSELPKPPSILKLGKLQNVVIAPSADGGLWIGHARGLFYTNRQGQWSKTGVTQHVTSLLPTADGGLWIGTTAGLIGKKKSGDTFNYGPDVGCDLRKVRFMAMGPGKMPVIVGDNAQSKQRIILINNDQCSSYRASPEQPWLTAVSRADDLIVLTHRRIYSLRPRGVGARKLSRDGMRLLPVQVKPDVVVPKSPYVIHVYNATVPSGARAIANAGDELLIGTEHLGVARMALPSGKVRWLRAGALVKDGGRLSVACARVDDCYVANGSTNVWRYNGSGFKRFGKGKRKVLAVARSRRGTVAVLIEGLENKEIVVARIEKGLVRRTGVRINTPGERPVVTFARFSPAEILWVGLRYHEEASSTESRPYGVALVDISLGAVVYHHASSDIKELKKGVLPIPINVSDVCFHGEEDVWLATSEGAALVRGEKVKVYSEAHGLESEILRGAGCTRGGMVYVASRRGIGSYDGEAWRHPRALRGAVNDLEIAPTGRLWMATDRGLAVYDGAKVRRFDTRRGLLDNRVHDIAIDYTGRIWARAGEGITLVRP